MTRRFLPALATAGAMLALGGCTSLTGFGGSATYACQAPEGVTCNSVSGVYAKAVRGNLPSQLRVAAPVQVPSNGPVPPRSREPASSNAADPDELRSRPRILRLWFKPWEDADNDLYDQGYVYVQVDAGRWRVDHVQARIRDGFAPVRPPLRVDGASPAGDSRSGQRAPLDAAQQPRLVPRPAVQDPTE
jgi:conjugal transfer pilus assembly protein TraV